LREFPIFSWVNKIWPTADVLSQPGTLPSHSSSLIEFPQSLATLDYVSIEQMEKFLERYVVNSSKSAMTYHIALNADTVHITLPKLEFVLQNIFKQASEGKFQLSMLQIPDMNWSFNRTTPLVSDTFNDKDSSLSPRIELSH